MIDISSYKVVYNERVLRAVAMAEPYFEEDNYPDLGKTVRPKVLQIHAINEDGNIVTITDESWRFQFIPVVGSGGR